MSNAYNDYGREIVVSHEYGWYKVPGAVSGVWLPKVVDVDGHQQVDVQAMPGGDGAYTTATHTAPTMGVASAVVLAANGSRLYGLIINDSDTLVYLALGVPAVVNQGIRLNPNGGSYEMSPKLGTLWLGQVNGISSVANKTVLVTEGV